jgi:hypothetical protein
MADGSYTGNPKDFIDIFLQEMDKHAGEVDNLYTGKYSTIVQS